MSKSVQNGRLIFFEEEGGVVTLEAQFCRTPTVNGFEKYIHRGVLRGIPGRACPQPEPNATELPSCAPISASC